MTNKKLWGGRFSSSTNKLVENMSESISYDQRLYKVDILASKAHVMALQKAKILSVKETDKIFQALDSIQSDIEENRITFSTELEDIHMNIEQLLTDRVGALGKKIHTGRSRNDQVATDIRLYLKNEILNIKENINNMRIVLIEIADKNIDVIMPGFTHMQIAQPVLFSHHIMAYYEMLSRDCDRLIDLEKRVSVLPLGSAALAGNTYNLDREYIAKQLGFDSVSSNSMDAVSDRDFIIEFLSFSSILFMHLSKFSEELILWLSPQFDFVKIDDAFTTGSSIMPQKRNPDIAELTRGKSGRIYGNLMTILTITKGLPLTYNRDLQEDKEPLFDTVDSLNLVLPVYTEMIKTIQPNKSVLYESASDGFSVATDIADFLTKNEIPFREAHNIVGKIVKHCEEKHIVLEDMSAEDFYKFIPETVKLPSDMSELISVESSLNARDVVGGTARKQVEKAIRNAKKKL
jgi:argininosuccinate lyase